MKLKGLKTFVKLFLCVKLFLLGPDSVYLKIS